MSKLDVNHFIVWNTVEWILISSFIQISSNIRSETIWNIQNLYLTRKWRSFLIEIQLIPELIFSVCYNQQKHVVTKLSNVNQYSFSSCNFVHNNLTKVWTLNSINLVINPSLGLIGAFPFRLCMCSYSRCLGLRGSSRGLWR